ncbi:MAG: hypothetical protein L0K38_10835 [Yaniella sp.]|uniref:hypothetical protein n=1 Tax=Yaniella sp. TaxID=2773929 RepID=UPI002647250F|nr:hypothetical protein [Yaniella sp.]MDN6457530.1 hypothetical protein [Yaniella sp.]MDN6522245.1 hypothetical protein [Bifidobacterium crudilactis]
MSLRDGWPAVSNAADQFDIRAALRVDTALDSDGNIKTGVAVTGKSLSGLVTARSDMQVDVAAFAATLDRQGPVKLYNDGAVQVKLDAAPTANSRIDAIYVKQQETASPISDSADGPIFGKVTGTPSTSPVAPTVPAGAMRLADVTIPSTATSTSSSGVTITQRYPFTASAGGWMQFRSTDDLNAWSAPDGNNARLLDGTEYHRVSGAWVREPMMQRYSHGIIAHGIPAGTEWVSTGTFDRPFTMTPAVWAIATTPALTCSIKNITTTGYQLTVRSAADAAAVEYINVYAYGS